MFRDVFNRANERLDALGFSTNLIDGKTAASSTRANAASFGLVARKTEANLTRANLTEQNARVNLSSNLRAGETAAPKTLGFCQNAADQIYAKDKFAKKSVNLTANEANSSGFSRGKFNETAVRESELSGLQSANLMQIKTVDIHSHLLSADVKFDRFYDKLALAFFAKKFDINKRELIKTALKATKATSRG